MGLFFKQRAIRQFDYKPLYWNETKDRIKEAEERAKRELGMITEDGKEEGEEGVYKPLIRRGTFREQRSTLPIQKRHSTIFRVLAIAFALIAIVFFVLERI